MDEVKGRMCSLPVVVSAALCSYINLLDEEARRKPLNILQQLMKSVAPDSSNQYYAERSVHRARGHFMSTELPEFGKKIRQTAASETCQFCAKELHCVLFLKRSVLQVEPDDGDSEPDDH